MLDDERVDGAEPARGNAPEGPPWGAHRPQRRRPTAPPRRLHFLPPAFPLPPTGVPRARTLLQKRGPQQQNSWSEAYFFSHRADLRILDFVTTSPRRINRFNLSLNVMLCRLSGEGWWLFVLKTQDVVVGAMAFRNLSTRSGGLVGAGGGESGKKCCERVRKSIRLKTSTAGWLPHKPTNRLRGCGGVSHRYL